MKAPAALGSWSVITIVLNSWESTALVIVNVWLPLSETRNEPTGVTTSIPAAASTASNVVYGHVQGLDGQPERRLRLGGRGAVEASRRHVHRSEQRAVMLLDQGGR